MSESSRNLLHRITVDAIARSKLLGDLALSGNLLHRITVEAIARSKFDGHPRPRVGRNQSPVGIGGSWSMALESSSTHVSWSSRRWAESSSMRCATSSRLPLR